MIQSPRDRLYSIWFAHWSPSKGNHACRCGAEWQDSGSRGIIMASARLMFSQCGKLRLLTDTKQVPNQHPLFPDCVQCFRPFLLSSVSHTAPRHQVSLPFTFPLPCSD